MPFDIVETLQRLQITHVAWLPDSALGGWEAAFDRSPEPRLLRVCREGEAWALAAGLYLGGCRPLVVIQNTGFFESGDAMRNVLFDLGLPLYAIVGYRGYLIEGSTDTARRFTEPVLKAWGIDYVLIEPVVDGDSLAEGRRLEEHYHTCRRAGRPGVALWAEGRG
jgi:sulfopyruvate decarboxylase subunit alpha